MQDKDFSQRVHVIAMALILVALATSARLFWLQVVRHSYYTNLAAGEQLRKFEVLPERGTIYANDRGQLYPLAVSQDLQRLYADPRYVTDPTATAVAIANVTGDDVNSLETALKTKNTAYVVLKHGLDSDTAKKIDGLNLAGIGLQDEPVRAYPESSLASQVLGFVNADGDGQYGIEQELNKTLAGQKGLLKATTDIHGIPIATSNNYQVPPQRGADVVLTIDRNIQAEVEKALASGIKTTKADSASAVIIDPKTGAIMAMANYPTFDPSKYSSVTDYSLFSNRVVNDAYEPGSVMKLFSMSAGLQTGAVTPDTTFSNPGFTIIDGQKIENAEGTDAGTHSMTDVIKLSINSGVIFVLEQLGGGQITAAGKQILYNYYTKNFHFGQATGIDLPNEPGGVVQPPSASDVDYAAMTFGQGITATMIQIVDDYAAIANGGTLYQPYVVDGVIAADGKVTKTVPKVRATNIINATTDNEIKAMMRQVVAGAGGGGFPTNIAGYNIGGKTGTAQIADPATGKYYPNEYIGSFGGVATLDNPQFVMLVRVDNPRVTTTGFAGSGAAAPIFAEIMRWLLNYKGLAPTG